MTLKVERASGEVVPGRVATEVQRATQARPDLQSTQATKEELRQMEAKLNITMRALARELADLKSWINDARARTSNRAVDKESVDHGPRENRRELRGLRRYLTQVDEFLEQDFPPRSTILATTI